VAKCEPQQQPCCCYQNCSAPCFSIAAAALHTALHLVEAQQAVCRQPPDASSRASMITGAESEGAFQAALQLFAQWLQLCSLALPWQGGLLSGVLPAPGRLAEAVLLLELRVVALVAHAHICAVGRTQLRVLLLCDPKQQQISI
jgi:hypothetical protein